MECAYNEAGLSLVVEFRIPAKRFDGVMVERVNTGIVIEENADYYSVEEEGKAELTIVYKNQVIDSNLYHADNCKCHKFCY